MKCPYCNHKAELVGGDVIYPYREDLYNLKFWSCPECDAYVGCHKPSIYNNFRISQPLGRMANANLRQLKSKVHKAFDPTWRTTQVSRGEAYKKLAESMEIPGTKCHIGMFDESQCLQALKILKGIL